MSGNPPKLSFNTLAKTAAADSSQRRSTAGSSKAVGGQDEDTDALAALSSNKLPSRGPTVLSIRGAATSNGIHPSPGVSSLPAKPILSSSSRPEAPIIAPPSAGLTIKGRSSSGTSSTKSTTSQQPEASASSTQSSSNGSATSSIRPNTISIMGLSQARHASSFSPNDKGKNRAAEPLSANTEEGEMREEEDAQMAELQKGAPDGSSSQQNMPSDKEEGEEEGALENTPYNDYDKQEPHQAGSTYSNGHKYASPRDRRNRDSSDAGYDRDRGRNRYDEDEDDRRYAGHGAGSGWESGPGWGYNSPGMRTDRHRDTYESSRDRDARRYRESSRERRSHRDRGDEYGRYSPARRYDDDDSHRGSDRRQRRDRDDHRGSDYRKEETSRYSSTSQRESRYLDDKYRPHNDTDFRDHTSSSKRRSRRDSRSLSPARESDYKRIRDERTTYRDSSRYEDDKRDLDEKARRSPRRRERGRSRSRSRSRSISRSPKARESGPDFHDEPGAPPHPSREYAPNLTASNTPSLPPHTLSSRIPIGIAGLPPKPSFTASSAMQPSLGRTGTLPSKPILQSSESRTKAAQPPPNPVATPFFLPTPQPAASGKAEIATEGQSDQQDEAFVGMQPDDMYSPTKTNIQARMFTLFGCSKLDDYKLEEKLGEGTFGVVHKARRKAGTVQVLSEDEMTQRRLHERTALPKTYQSKVKEGDVVALKKIVMHNDMDGVPITALREIRILKSLNHPNVVPVVDMAFQEGDYQSLARGTVYMVFPYMAHDLAGLLENKKILTLEPSLLKLYAKQLLEGTSYLHRNKILHRDMKAANLLIDDEGVLQIADFGLARSIEDPKENNGSRREYTNCVVTRWYRPPELLLGLRAYGRPIDMWGVGCVIGEMFFRHPIFTGSSDLDQVARIVQMCGTIDESSMPGYLSMPDAKNIQFSHANRNVKREFSRFSDELADLLDKLLILDPETRLTADAALDHEWFWTDPLPATPGSVKVFPSSHEYDKRKAQEERSHHGSDKNRAAQEAAFRGPNSVVKMPGQVQMPAQQQQIQQQPQPAMPVPYMSQPFNARAVQPQYQAAVPQQQQWPAALPGRPVGSFPTAAALPRIPNQAVPSMPYAQPVYSNPPSNHPLPYGQPQQRPFQPTYQPPIAPSSTLPPLPPSLPAKPGGMRFNQMVSSASAASRMKSSASAGDVDPYRRRNSPPRKIAGTSAASERSGRPP